MTDAADQAARVAGILKSAEVSVHVENERFGPDERDGIVALLRAAEADTPGAVSLHAQLDTVTKWVDALARPEEHARFGGTDRVREHVAMQFRLARAAAEDYFRQRG